MRIKEEENSYVVEPDEAKHEGVVKIYRDNATIKLDYEKNQDFINIVKMQDINGMALTGA